MNNELDVLQLVRVPVADGTLYLYPEHVGQADNFSFTFPSQPLRGSRKIFRYSPNQEFSFVAKEERLPNDHYRAKYGYRWNSAAREISIARLFSLFACFEDEHAFVSHEVPYGFHESKEGVRTSLYQHYPFTKGVVDPISLSEIITSLNKKEQEEIRNANASSKLQLMDIKDKYMHVRHKAKELYYPCAFATVLLRYNGLDHNEGTYKSPVFIREDGKSGRIILDFEFCQPEQPPSIEQSIDYWLYNCTPVSTSSGTDLDHFLSKPPQERRNWAMEQMETASTESFYSVIARRFRDYLGDTGYFEGEIKEFGPAYNLLLESRKLRLDDFVIP